MLRELGVGAVDGGRGRGDHVRAAGAAGGFQNLERAGRVGVMAGQGVTQGARHRGESGQVDDGVGTAECLVEESGVLDVSFEEVDV